MTNPKHGRDTPSSKPRDVDLHKYQVLTIPFDLQKEIASLPLPQLSDSELKPLPRIEQSSQEATPPVKAQTGFLKFLYKERVVLLCGLAGIIGVIWITRPNNGNKQALAASNSAVAPSVMAPAIKADPTVEALPATVFPVKAPSSAASRKTPVTATGTSTSSKSQPPTTEPAESPSTRPVRRGAVKPD